MKRSIVISGAIVVASLSHALAGPPSLIGTMVHAKLTALNYGSYNGVPIHEVQDEHQFVSPKTVRDPDPGDPQTHSEIREFNGYVTSRFCPQEWGGSTRESVVRVSVDVDAETATIWVVPPDPSIFNKYCGWSFAVRLWDLSHAIVKVDVVDAHGISFAFSSDSNSISSSLSVGPDNFKDECLNGNDILQCPNIVLNLTFK